MRTTPPAVYLAPSPLQHCSTYKLTSDTFLHSIFELGLCYFSVISDLVPFAFCIVSGLIPALTGLPTTSSRRKIHPQTHFNISCFNLKHLPKLPKTDASRSRRRSSSSFFLTLDRFFHPP
ncbi:hypothetical protein BFJ63_vAg12751 [Fusarium oxysporum f. sp. narcissi]|uniref:Uncharacterized protein n=2 Tax=Fusarium oxysporum TaxID=5507 RepID=A0A420P253_FUSOX|nr:hypothetical protein FocnCong_v018369 [Fusarium oxysporum f. sp. conglutinans]RKK86612.1 hypothetical protein BFJ69_g836 [Fusarium oxysporum]RKK87392.1 hypothetical protein BFJ71_g13403 [Fusarium oxysporum]RKL13413.1 hypothetical protein BFJ68_g7080 [Fusarium oxysporum]RYC84383.1 hypothetical protein BFJ63_vAg12751 [Fusarium oxysporum f. sp. narcissi]